MKSVSRTYQVAKEQHMSHIFSEFDFHDINGNCTRLNILTCVLWPLHLSQEWYVGIKALGRRTFDEGCHLEVAQSGL